MKQWKPLPFIDGYDVSEDGDIKRVKGGQGRRVGQCLRPHPSSNGYLQVFILDEGKRKNVAIHRAVCAAFYGPCPDGIQVRHLDGNKLNNKISNLEYGTPKQNGEDNVRLGVMKRGETKPQAKITQEQAQEIVNHLSNDVSATAISMLLEIPRNIVYKIKYGESWAWLQPANNRNMDRAAP